MTAWTFLGESDPKEWDSRLATLDGTSVYQKYGWGELKRSLGWTVTRMIRGETDAPIAMAQILVRRVPFGGIVCWVPGGPAGEVALWSTGLSEALRKALSAHWLFLRINAMHRLIPGAAESLSHAGWRRPSMRFATGQSLTYDPSIAESERMALASANWRHNLKRSGKYGLVVRKWDSPKAAELQEIYQSMEHHKGLGQTMGDSELATLLDCMRDNMLLYRCDDRNGNTIALRACAINANRAWDLLAAASPAARKQYASYATLWALLNECSRLGVKSYDMGGVDPTGNKGVFDFKRGLGAQPLVYLGEWEWASASWVRLLANLALRWKGLAP